MTPAASAPRQAAEALKAAIDRHLAACEARQGESDATVQDSYEALRDAAENYDDVLYDALEEITPFEFRESSAAVLGDTGSDEVPGRIGLLLRRDYVVDDLDALLASGRSAAVRTDEDSDETPAESVVSPGRAVYELLATLGVDGLDEAAEDSGLEPVGGTVWLVAEDDDDETLFDGPFEAVDSERLLYRVDEIFEG